MKTAVIIVAAGSGNRMGGDIPKQFLPLAGRPILVHTVQRVEVLFAGAEIIVVVSPSEETRWREIATEHGLTGKHEVCHGGATRFESVRNAVEMVGECDLIAVHDGVRPFFTRCMVDDLTAAAMACGAAIPTVEAVDSFRMITPNGSRVVDRSLLRAVQTPQLFRADLLKEAYREAPSAIYTDDASLVESFGTKIALCQGDYANIKITTPADLEVAAGIINR